MKRNLFSIALISALAIAFVGCNDDLVKDDIDAKYNRDATISAPVVTDVTDASANVTYTAEFDTTNLVDVYCGIMISTTEDFVDSTSTEIFLAPGEVKEITVVGDTKYYAKSYIAVGTGVKYSEVTAFQTEKPKEFVDKYLFGAYTAFDDGDDESTYDMEISWIEGTSNRINIINFWDGGETVTASVDFEKKQIALDFEPKVAEEEGYGWYILYAVDAEENLIDTEKIVGTYDADGNISFLYGVFLENHGELGTGTTDMVKKSE